jgi:hypothetical protein
MNLQEQLARVQVYEDLQSQILNISSIYKKRQKNKEYQNQAMESLFAKIWDYENGIINENDQEYDEGFASWLYPN